MSYREHNNSFPEPGRGCAEQGQYNHWSGLGPETEGSLAQHAAGVIKRSSWGWRIAGGAAAAIGAYLPVAAMYEPAREPLISVVEALTGEDINDSAPASYTEMVKLYNELSAPNTYNVDADAIKTLPDMGESFAYQQVTGETPYLHP